MLYPSFDELTALKHKASNLCLTSDRVAASIGAGDHHSPFRGQGLDFEEVRAYAPGDDIRSIDWRVTARTGVPHTKVFREERERTVILCVDVNVGMRFGTKKTFKSIQAARVAALLGWQACMSHDRLGACLFGDVPGGLQFFAPHRSTKSLLAMLKQLSRTDLNENASPISLEKTLTHLNKVSSRGALIYIISDFATVDSALEQQLRALRKRCDVVLIPINDPADSVIPPIGPVLFSNHGQGKAYIDTTNQMGRKKYTSQWLQMRQTLLQISIKLKIGFIPIPTDADGDAQTELFFGLKRIRQGKGKR